jgi:putative DNA primase/helicase
MVSTDTPYSNVDLGAVESWVRLIHGESQGFVHICSTLSWVGNVFHVATDMERIKKYVQRLHDNGAKGIYMRATTVAGQPDRDKRGSIEDSVTLPGFWADIDLAGPGHKTNKPLPPTVEEAARIIQEARLPEPTLWVHSGGGVYPWWLFQTPVLMVNGEIVAGMQDMSERWHQCLVDAAERLGYSYGAMADLSRVLRVPGTLNRKLDDPQPMCQIVWDEGPRFSDEDIEAALETAEMYRATVTPTPKREIPRPRPAESGERPGDALANQYTWEEILEPHGYQFDRQQGEETYWVRPGKNRRDGHSCTTNYQGSGLLYVFTDAMDGFEPNRSYGKFAAWSILNGYGENCKAAAKDLRSRGFGSTTRQQDPHLQPTPLQPAAVESQTGGAGQPRQVQQVTSFAVEPQFDYSDTGNAERMVRTHGNRFRYVPTLSEWYAWNGQVWQRDETSLVNQAAKSVVDQILVEAKSMQDASEAHQEIKDNPDKLDKCRCPGCRAKKFYTTSRSANRMLGMVKLFGIEQGISIGPDEFDRARNVITVGNGVLNPETRELTDFDPGLMLTKRLGANYDPTATAPKFEKFIESVLPDPAMRDYVQRALGYTLLGENDQRAMFIIEGKSGTGKSQFLNIFTRLFGDFGATAAATAFRETRNESTFELHALRGRRFVTTSETSDASKMDEELLKRLTGRDDVTTRNLFQPPVTWTPGFAIWMATNFAPRMNADDSAIWDRCKYIKFDQQFVGERRIPDLGNKIVAEEASGILNWLLDGVAAYRERGLQDPEQVREAVEAQRLESDSVAQFLIDGTEGDLLVKEEGAEVRSSTLYKVYVEWCQREHIPRLGNRRFAHRMKGLGYEQFKSSVMHWRGLRLNGQTGILGTMG